MSITDIYSILTSLAIAAIVFLYYRKNHKKLFSWDEIPGNDDGKLIEFITQKFSIDWLRTAKIEKIDNSNIITVTSGENFLSLKLNDEENNVILKIDDGTTFELNARRSSQEE